VFGVAPDGTVVNRPISTSGGDTYPALVTDADGVVWLVDNYLGVIKIESGAVVGKTYTVKNMTTSTANLTLAVQLGDTLDGVLNATRVLVPGRALDTVYDGTTWLTHDYVIPQYTSPALPIITSSTILLNHGLGEIPAIIRYWLVCTTAQNGYAIGDRLDCLSLLERSGATFQMPMSIVPTATQIRIQFNASASCFDAPSKDTGITAAITNAYWQMYFHART
jgi:hypothetical protein